MSAIPSPPSTVSNVEPAGPTRAEWVAPDVTRLTARQAELNPTITNDSEGSVS